MRNPEADNRSVNNVFALGLALQLPLFFMHGYGFIRHGAPDAGGGTLWPALGLFAFLFGCLGIAISSSAFFMSLSLENVGRYRIAWIRWAYLIDVVVLAAMFTAAFTVFRGVPR